MHQVCLYLVQTHALIRRQQDLIDQHRIQWEAAKSEGSGGPVARARQAVIARIEDHLSGANLDADEVSALLNFATGDSKAIEFVQRGEQSLRALQGITCSALNLDPSSVRSFEELADAVKTQYIALSG